MGNQHPGANSRSGYATKEEPLESMREEMRRDDHLKNLDFKRSKSIRRSIAKRISRRKKKKQHDGVEERPPSDLPDGPVEDESKAAKAVEKPQELNGGSTKTKTCLTAGEPQPFPAHVQNTGESGQRMEKLRKSFRASIRKKKDSSPATPGQKPHRTDSNGSTSGKPHQWQSDEVSVRSGNCSFQVKYLGSVEVFESRGMAVCEEAIKVLKHSKRKSVKSVLHVSGDGLRVVDDDTKGLIVDQTIEKVSFCAPDRNYERGFSYICRDGTTRRWMCHGFIAIKESGERLSHAVGCAFAICLERKQKRDKECAVTMNFNTSDSSFTRLGSFRQAPISERLQDPQVLKPGPEQPPKEENVVNPFAIARPHATDSMLLRQTSFRGLQKLQEVNSPFKRQLSLRISELPSFVEQQKQSRLAASKESPFNAKDITEGDDQPSEVAVSSNHHMSDLESLTISHTNEAIFDEPYDKFKNSFMTKSFGVSHLEPVPENQSESETVPEDQQEFSSLPFVPTFTSSSSEILQPEKVHRLSMPSSSHCLKSSPTPTKKERAKPVFDNPWDLVPDQPLNNNVNKNLSNCDSSSGISSTSSSYVVKQHSVVDQPAVSNGNKWLDEVSDSLKRVQEEDTSSTSDNIMKSLNGDGNMAGVLDDPFDAEWAALATRGDAGSKNPFRMEETTDNQLQKTFELQL